MGTSQQDSSKALDERRLLADNSVKLTEDVVHTRNASSWGSATGDTEADGMASSRSRTAARGDEAGGGTYSSSAAGDEDARGWAGDRAGSSSAAGGACSSSAAGGGASARSAAGGRVGSDEADGSSAAPR